MAATLEDLEKRLAQVECEVARLRQFVEVPSPEETPAERGAQLLYEAALHQAQIAAGWAKAMEQMGISGEPVGAEKVQAMIAAGGINLEENEFSRSLMDMREE
jgi:DNA-binding transcriptional regulator LsrR (DeoR family)